jgi:hypothetical protein
MHFGLIPIFAQIFSDISFVDLIPSHRKQLNKGLKRDTQNQYKGNTS